MTTRPVVCITSRSFGRHSARGVQALEAAGCEVIFAGAGGPHPEEAMCAYARQADALIVGADPVTASVLAAGPRLRVVAKHGVGVDNIDLAAARARGIVVTYAPGGNTRAVAEMTMAMLLCLWRGLARADAAMRARRWAPVIGREARGRTLGIVGLGRIGREVATIARALGMQVVAYDVVEDAEFARAHHVRYDALSRVLGAADAVTIHVPLTETTRGLIGARELAQMRPDAVLINVSRGGVVDEQALADALAAGRLAGAAVDVYEREPPWDSPLLTLDNVLLTPHIAHATVEAMDRVDATVAADVVAVLRGAPARYAL
jgi:D-3-phosphoglycerate dehydrogenase